MPSSETISARTDRFVEATMGSDPRQVSGHLASQRVCLELDAGFANSFVGQVILFSLLNLVVRLDTYCPKLDVVLPTVERHPLLRLLSEGPLRASLESFFGGFPAASRLNFMSDVRRDDQLTVQITPRVTESALSVWSNGWQVYLRSSPPVVTDDPNPVGANVAAGLAAAELFKRLLNGLPLRSGLRVLPVDQLVLSTYDYTLGEGANPSWPTTVELDGVVVVGLGGVGAGFTAAASSSPSIAGRITLVDRDELDETNLNRHLVAVPGDTGAKVDVCRRALAFHDQLDARCEWFDDYVSAHGVELDVVVVGVDNDPVRRRIQSTLPRVVLNGGTSDSASFRVSRHDYAHGACLSCLAREDLQDHPSERALAQQLGVDLDAVLAYQRSGEPMPTALLAQAGKLSREDAELLGGHSLAEIQMKICSQLRLGPGPEAEAVSISFLSALPGFLLLGEVVKERSFGGALRPPLNESSNHLLLSVLGRPHPGLLRGWMDRRPGCDCDRPAYRKAYARKWASAP